MDEALSRSSGRFQRDLALIVLCCLLVLSIGLYLLRISPPGVVFEHVLGHQLLETAGSLIAVVVLILIRSKEISPHLNEGEHRWFSAGLGTMALLDFLHAAHSPGNAFVWFHSISTAAGGALFAGVFVSPVTQGRLPWLPRGVAALILLFALLCLVFPDMTPLMLADGQFTPLARLLNVGGGLAFICAAAYFLARYHKTGLADFFVIGLHALLFGLAGALFELSTLWDAPWWWWHVVRFVSYLLLAVFVLRIHDINSRAALAVPANPAYLKRLPVQQLLIVAGISLLPQMLSIAGLDFTGLSQVLRLEDAPFGFSQKLLSAALVNNGLLWSSVMLAAFTAVLALTHYRASGDVVAAIIGMALCCVGVMDAFCVIIALQRAVAGVSADRLLPYIWALSATFNAGILIVGALISLRARIFRLTGGMVNVTLICIAFSLVACLLIESAAAGDRVPQTLFADSLIVRPYDVAPLVLFVLALPVFYALHRHSMTIITACALLSLLPLIMAQLNMVFGSPVVYDSHSTIAHLLKIFSCVVLLFGFVVANMRVFRAQQADRKNRVHAIMNASQDGILTVDSRGVIQSFNKTAERIFGITANDAIDRHVSLLLPAVMHAGTDDKTGPSASDRLALVQWSGERTQGRRKSGETFPMELAISEITYESEQQFVIYASDITERKLAEEKLQRFMEDLRYSNEELERFAYVASHDLKSPLRAIDNLSQWLVEDLKGQLQGKPLEYLLTIRNRVMRMEHLLDDLLEYSRVGRPQISAETISAFELLQRVLLLLDVPETIVIDVHPDLKDISIATMPLGQVLQNLIGNAIKHHDKPRGRISVSACDTVSGYEFVVEDDGPGIPAEYHEKIFGMFQTLKPRDEVEGSGMGLAIVRKILHQNGGRIWLESQPGQGSRFIFLWPRDA